MARDESTKTHLENLAILPQSAHGDTTGDAVFAIYPLDQNPLSPGTPSFKLDDVGHIDQVLTNTTAAGDQGIYAAVSQSSTALTGTLRGGYFVATNGTGAATGTVRGVEAKARAYSDTTGAGGNAAMLEGILISADAKKETVTGLRGLHVQLDGYAGSTTTLVEGVLINNNSSGTQTTAYAISINEGHLSGHKVFTRDILLQNGETIDNATDGTVAITSAVIKHALDANDYWTVTQANSGGVTFDSTSAGTASFTFNDPVTVTNSTASTTATLRSVIGSITASTASMTTCTLTAVRGVITVSGSTTGSASCYMYGTQGKFIGGGTLNNAAGWHAGVFAQLDLSAGTYTAAQIAGLWVDCGLANASAKALGAGSTSMIRITNTASGFLPTMISAVANAAYFLDIAAADGTPGYYAANTHTIDSHALASIIKVKVGGTEGYIPVFASVPA